MGSIWQARTASATPRGRTLIAEVLGSMAPPVAVALFAAIVMAAAPGAAAAAAPAAAAAFTSQAETWPMRAVDVVRAHERVIACSGVSGCYVRFARRGTYTLTLRARGQYGLGGWPLAAATVDGFSVAAP